MHKKGKRIQHQRPLREAGEDKCATSNEGKRKLASSNCGDTCVVAALSKVGSMQRSAEGSNPDSGSSKRPRRGEWPPMGLKTGEGYDGGLQNRSTESSRCYRRMMRSNMAATKCRNQSRKQHMATRTRKQCDHEGNGIKRKKKLHKERHRISPKKDDYGEAKQGEMGSNARGLRLKLKKKAEENISDSGVGGGGMTSLASAGVTHTETTGSN